jgi:hypothetical protein
MKSITPKGDPMYIVEVTHEGDRSWVRVGSLFERLNPIIDSFVTLAGLLTQFKLGLARNSVCEGGFVGRTFEARYMESGDVRYGISVRHYADWAVQYAQTPEQVGLGDKLLDLCEKQVGADYSASAEEAISFFIFALEHLLRIPRGRLLWSMFSKRTDELAVGLALSFLETDEERDSFLAFIKFD